MWVLILIVVLVVLAPRFGTSYPVSVFYSG
jgi:hypothetical protein